MILNNIKKGTALLGVLAIIAMLLSGVTGTMAVGLLKVNIDYIHNFKTDILNVDDSFCYIFSPVDGAPSQFENNEYWIKGYGETTGKVSMSFSKAGTYSYQVFASPNYRVSGYTYEKKSYMVTLIVTETNGTLKLKTLLIEGNDGYKYDKLRFDPTYNESVTPSATPTPTLEPSPSASVSPSPTGSWKDNNNGSSNNGSKGQYTPKTGDDTPLATLISLAVLSAGMVFFLIWRDRRNKKKEGDEK